MPKSIPKELIYKRDNSDFAGVKLTLIDQRGLFLFYGNFDDYQFFGRKVAIHELDVIKSGRHGSLFASIGDMHDRIRQSMIRVTGYLDAYAKTGDYYG